MSFTGENISPTSLINTLKCCNKTTKNVCILNTTIWSGIIIKNGLKNGKMEPQESLLLILVSEKWIKPGTCITEHVKMSHVSLSKIYLLTGKRVKNTSHKNSLIILHLKMQEIGSTLPELVLTQEKWEFSILGFRLKNTIQTVSILKDGFHNSKMSLRRTFWIGKKLTNIICKKEWNISSQS